MRLFAAALTAMPLLALTTVPARADLSFANPLVNVGEVRSGAPLKQAFAFVNQGPAGVEIFDLRTSCGCVKPKLDKRAYQPGERGEIVLEVHTLSQPAGERTWRLQVGYHDGAQTRETELTLKGQVIADVTVQPVALTIWTEGTASHQLVLTDRRPRPLAVTGLQPSLPSLTGTVKEATDADGHRVIAINLVLKADCPVGRHDETLRLLTDDPVYNTLTVPVTIIKRPKQKVTAAPSTVTLSASPGQPIPSRIVLLRASGNGLVHVERVEADDPCILCKWASGPDTCATLKVSIDHAKLPADVLAQRDPRAHQRPCPGNLDPASDRQLSLTPGLIGPMGLYIIYDIRLISIATAHCHCFSPC